MNAFEDDDAITGMMLRYGGSFARALAHAFRCGDGENRRRIKAGWSDLWAQYGELSQMQHQRAAKAERPTR